MQIYELENITYQLSKLRKTLVFQVLKQNESTIKKTKDMNWEVFKASNGLEIISATAPNIADIEKNKLYLRGISDVYCLNFAICCYDMFKTNEIRDEYYDKIVKGFEEWDLAKSK